MTNAFRTSLALCSLLALAACSASKPSLGGGASNADIPSSDGGGQGPEGDATAGSGDNGLMFGSGDAGPTLGTGVCKQGSYSGPFTTDFYLVTDGGATWGLPTDASIVQLTGTITLDVTPSTSGELNYVVSGTFHASTTSLISADAQLSGSLDCASGKLSGQVSNGTYSGWLVIMGTFDGPMSADYDGTRFAFVNGVWNLHVSNSGLVQNGELPGTWSADYVGDP